MSLGEVHSMRCIYAVQKWLQFLCFLSLSFLQICFYSEVAGVTVVPLSWGMYLAIEPKASALVLLYSILGSGFNWYLEFVFLCCALIALSNKPKRRRRWLQTGNLAFGGRGVGIWRSKRRRKGRLFDSTLGYPGEGWSSTLHG